MSKSDSEEEDFMSDAFLASAVAAGAAASTSTAPQSRKRSPPRREPAPRTLSKRELAEQERERRLEGLERNLMASYDDGRGESKAQAMMRKMGYVPGAALGSAAASGSGSGVPPRRSRSPDLSEDESSSAGETSSSRRRSRSPPARGVVQPIRPDERFGSSRMGIGSAAVSRAISAAAASSAAKAGEAKTEQQRLDEFRAQRRGVHEERKIEGQLASARTTSESLDRKAGAEYSPLWLSAHWFAPGRVPPAEAEELINMALGPDNDELVPNAVLAPIRTEEEAEKDRVSQERRDEARRWISLPAAARLAITLDHLRSVHHYCLFCGCAYADADELAQQCPGTDEEAHD